MRNNPYLPILLLLLLPRLGTGQTSLPSTPNLNLANFQQLIDVYEWQYRLGWGARRGSNTFALGMTFNASMLRQGEENKWKDHQIAFFMWQKALSPRMRLLLDLRYTLFQDELSAFNYDRRLSGFTLAGQWNVRADVDIQPEIGYRWERRSELLESGIYGAFLLDASRLRFNAYTSRLYAWAEATRYKNRKNSNARLRYAIWRQFQQGTRDSLVVYYDFLRRDNFFTDPLSGKIESLQKAQRGIENYLIYRTSSRSVFRIHSSLNFGNVTVTRLDAGRTIARRSHDDYRFSNRIQYQWIGDRLQTQIELDTGESAINYDIPDSSGFSPFSRRFATLGYDVEEKYTRFTQRVHFRLGLKDSLKFYFELSKFRHDNSDARNPDSYDEQRWHISLAHYHRFNSKFLIFWEASAFLKHFVYLDASFSSQNNWKRLFQLEPGLRFQPDSRFFFQQKVGVRAQYVDYDFDAMQPVKSSYVTRDFYLSDSLVVRIAPKISMEANYRYEIEELGSLDWARFSSRPRTLWKNQWLTFGFVQKLGRNVNLSMGAIFYRQSRFQFILDAERTLKLERIGTHINLGPRLRFSYSKQDGSVVLLSAERQKVFPMSGNAYFINLIQLATQWRF